MEKRPIWIQKVAVTSASCDTCGRELAVDYPGGEINPDENPIVDRCSDHPNDQRSEHLGRVDMDIEIFLGFSTETSADGEINTVAICQDGDGRVSIHDLSFIRFAVELEEKKKKKFDIEISKEWSEHDDDFFEPIKDWLPGLRLAAEKKAEEYIRAVESGEGRASFETTICGLLSKRLAFKTELEDEAERQQEEYTIEQYNYLVFWYEYHLIRHIETLQHRTMQ